MFLAVADHDYCLHPYETVVVVVAVVPHEDHHDCYPNESDCYYHSCANFVETMTTTMRMDCAERFRNDWTVDHDRNDFDSVENDDSMGLDYCCCNDYHCSSDDGWWTMTIFSRMVHPACIYSIYPSSMSQSSGSVIVPHSISHLKRTWHPFRITSGFYS